jgi:ABC-type branched-subunit amino acid transport system substrate-binding protein
MRGSKFVAIVAAGATVVAVASMGVAGARVQADARGVTSSSITVGGLGQTAFFGDSAQGAQARFNEENSKGGVFGRKINFVGFRDDKSDPSTDLAQAKQLVQQDQVLAIVPTLTPDLQSSQFLAQQHVPFFGWGISTGFCKNPYAFGFTGCIVPPTPVNWAGSTWGALIDQQLKNQGDPNGAKGKTAAVISEDNDSGRTGYQVIAASARSVGMKIVYAKNPVPAPPATVGDYSPFVNAILTSNNGKAPDVFFDVTSQLNTIGLDHAIIAAGFKGIDTNAVAYDPRLVSSSKGQTAFTQFDLPEDTSNSTMQKIVASIKQANGNKTITQPQLAGYFAADMFIQALKKTGKNLTPEALAKAAGSMTYEIKGIIGPTKYPRSQTYGAPCGTLAQDVDGVSYKIVAPYACYKNILINSLKTIP